MASPSSVHEAKPHNETPELLWHQSNQTTIKSKSRQVKVLINLSPTQRTWKGMTWTIEGFQFAMDGRWCPLVNMFCTVQRKRTEVHLEHHSIVRWQDNPVVYPNSRSRVKWPTTDRTTDTMRLNCGVRWIKWREIVATTFSIALGGVFVPQTNALLNPTTSLELHCEGDSGMSSWIGD